MRLSLSRRSSTSLLLLVSLLAFSLTGISSGTSHAHDTNTSISKTMPACQYHPHQQGTISTTGKGEVKVKPDAFRFTVSVQANNKDLEKTRADINQRMKQVISALKATNTQHLQLTTKQLNLHPVWSAYQKNKLRKKIGYQGQYRLQVQVTDTPYDQLNLIGSRLMDAALSAGAEGSGGIQFFVHDLTTARQNALKNAVEDAKQNANIMANTAGVKLGKVFSIDGSPRYNGGNSFPMPMMHAMARKLDHAEGGVSTPVEAGEVTVTSTVSIQFKTQE